MDKALTLGSASAFSLELNGNAAGLDYDQLALGGLTGGLTIASGSMLRLSLGYSAALGEVFTAIDNTTLGAIGGAFANAPDEGSVDVVFGGGEWSFKADYQGGDGNDLTLTVVAVPEPGAAALLLGASALLLGRRRRWA